MATSRLSTRRVEWRVQVGTSNKAAQGLVIFEASVSYIPDPLAAGGPRTAIPEPVAAVLDSGGYACTPDPANPAKAGERGVALFTTDSLGEDGGDWTWTARPQLRSVSGIQMAGAVPAFSFTVPTGAGSLDLSEVQKVPASPGLGTEAALALVLRAEKAAQDAKNVVGETVGQAAQAAVEAEVRNKDIVVAGDVGIPSEGQIRGYDEAVLNHVGRLARGLKTDGTNHLPRILTERIETPDSFTEHTDIPGYLKVSVNGAGQMAADAILSDGTRPQWAIDLDAKRMNIKTEAPIHLLVVAGQSNATKRGPETEATNATAYDDERVLRWSHGSGAIITETGTNWLGSGFARQWIKDNPTKRILIVEAAVGSTGFWGTSIRPTPAGYSETSGTWDRMLTADPNNFPTLLLRDRVATAAAAAKELTGVEPPKIAMLWSQGENDTGHAAEYAAKMDDLFTWTRNMWGLPNLPILVTSMTPATIRRTNGATTLDLAQQDTPRRLTLTAYHRGPEGLEENTANRTHYLPIAQERRGADMASRVLPRALRNKAAATPAMAVVPPENVEVNRFGSNVQISWEHPPCQLTAIVLETSTDSGATWSTHSLPVPAAIEHETTAPAAMPLWVRLSTINGANTSYYREVKA